MNHSKQILVVDDEREITDLLEVYLLHEGYTVHKFYSAAGVTECIRQNPIDLAVLDVMLPDTDGFALCREIRKEWYFPIIMLTAKVENEDKITGITLGADDYITKPFHPTEVIARIKAQLRRAETYNQALGSREGKRKDTEYYNIRGLEIDAADHTCRLYDEEISLTPIEFSIVLYLCRHMGQVIPTEELFEQVWGEKYFDSNNTVMAHIARLRDKLHENARKPKFIKTIWGVGYKMEEQG